MFNGYRWNGRIIEVREDRGFVENNKQDEEEEEKVFQSHETKGEELFLINQKLIYFRW